MCAACTLPALKNCNIKKFNLSSPQPLRGRKKYAEGIFFSRLDRIIFLCYANYAPRGSNNSISVVAILSASSKEINSALA